MADWTDIELFDPTDVSTIEPVMTDGLSISSALQAEVKDHFEAELRRRFSYLQDKIKVSSSEFDILDHVENPEKLARSARFYCLYMLFYGQRVGAEGEYAKKAEEYFSRYRLAFDDACQMLKFDEETEQYDIDYGSVRFVV